MTAPQITYLCETNQWRLEEAIELKGILIPSGFQFDLASIPRLLWFLIAPFELSLAAPLLHDFLYQNHSGGLFSRKQVDRLFLQLMVEEGIPMWRRHSAYVAVRLFGWLPWKERD